jgi:hypothetical protein
MVDANCCVMAGKPIDFFTGSKSTKYLHTGSNPVLTTEDR